MIGINQRRRATAQSRVAQSHRYAPFNLRTAPSLPVLEVLS